ncbi:uncharacterized protein LOC135349793 [Halichondria panicea]|uniref:uncharacterized protein LOC135349793 n=1 Tax=Halichondria panicea TaxID=6063 RepID=UPI00312B4503
MVTRGRGIIIFYLSPLSLLQVAKQRRTVKIARITAMAETRTVHSEGQKHTHLHACSTPIRPPPVPRALNDPVNQLPTDRTTQDITGQLVIKIDHQQQEDGRVVTFGQQKEIGKRRTKRAHQRLQRLQTKPRKPFVVSRNPPKTRPQIERKELKEKAAHLETELSTVRKGSLGFPDRLSEVQCSIERAQEELDMIWVTIAEKDTQLLHAHDQLLGLRQCFAHVLAGLKPVDSCKSCDHTHLSRDNGYELSSQLVDKLQSLVNDGNVERFLLEVALTTTRLVGTATTAQTPNSTLPEAELGTIQYKLCLEPSHHPPQPVV